MKEFECITKDYEKIMLKLIKFEGLSFRYYEIRASNASDSLVGRLGFEIFRDNSGAWLRNIQVVPEYLNRGVGSSMNGLFEQFLLQNGCEEISGNYIPMSEGAEFAWPFYTHNGYKITEDFDGNDTLSKTIERNCNVPQLIEYETKDAKYAFSRLDCEQTKTN